LRQGNRSLRREDHSTQFARNSIFGTIAGVSSALASFLASVIVAHLLGVEQTGAFTYALWIVTLTTTIAQLGVPLSLARYLPELMAAGEQEQGRRLAAFLIRPLVLASLVLLAGFAAYAAWVWTEGPDSDFEPITWLLIGVACALQTLANFTVGNLQGVQRFDRLALLTIASVILQLACITGGSMSFGVVGGLGGYCAGSVVTAAYCASFIRRDARLPGELRTRVIRYALFAWGGALGSAFVWSRAEVFFLQRSVGSEAVGLFTVGLTLSNLAIQGPMLLSTALLPYFAESYGKNALERMRVAFAAAMRLMAFLTLPACFGLAAIMPALLPLLYGRAFAGAVPVATVLTCSAAIGGTGFVGAHLTNGMDRSDFIFVSGLLGAALSIIAGLTVIPTFGLLGAALARASIQAFSFALGSWFITRRLQCPMPFRALGRLLIAALLCGLVARACLLLPSPIMALPAAIGAGALVYAVAARTLGALPRQDIERLCSLNQRLPAKLRMPLGIALRLVFGPVRPYAQTCL
jgi:O-antigen/teichoic acid export membrane protein